MSAKELRSKDKDELQTEIAALSKEMFNLRMQRAMSQTPRPHLFKKAKRRVALIKTILREKEGRK